ncbi:methyltransferase family protein [Aliiroseovarius sp. 2305UL8-7]|uniref:methyltransferase family protein n=1 Tax=Aliiroseovarius conchicola TaxID=3121637 RepID=UPI003526EEB8
MSQLTRWLDLPPVWLAGMIVGAYGLDHIFPGLGFGWGWSRWLGNVLIVVGLGAMGLAVWEFTKARTSVIPRQVPTAFLSRGIYRLSRNPIYLGDAMVLTGFVLRWDVLPALVLVPVFVWIITSRFILPEEAGLRAQFGQAFDDWSGKVRRWI